MSQLRHLLALAALALAACVDSQSPVEISQSLPTVPALTAAKQPPDEDPNHFNITLRFINPVSSSQEQIFAAAANRWSSIITGDVPATKGISKKACGPKFGAPRFNGLVDDVLIDIFPQPIDGPGNLVGSAGPCLLRAGDGLPAYGIMFLDVADLDLLERSGDLEHLLVHEIAHVLGFGQLWDKKGLLDVTTDPNHPAFIGDLAEAEYGALIGAGDTPVPVEGQNQEDLGAALGHWDEATFGHELMTSVFDPGDGPLSRVSVAAMGDLGYQVDLSPSGPADPYSLSGTRAFQRMAQVIHLREELIQPVGVVE